MIEEQIDTTKIELTRFDDAEADDIEYWMSKTPTERIEGIEYLRRWLYGDDELDASVQRLLSTARLDQL